MAKKTITKEHPITAFRKANEARNEKVMNSLPKDGGTYMAFKNGRVGRTNGWLSPYESMDTTGYAAGKKEFNLVSSLSGYKPTTTKISRRDVPSKIAEFKKGATRTIVESKNKTATKKK